MTPPFNPKASEDEDQLYAQNEPFMKDGGVISTLDMEGTLPQPEGLSEAPSSPLQVLSDPVEDDICDCCERPKGLYEVFTEEDRGKNYVGWRSFREALDRAASQGCRRCALIVDAIDTYCAGREDDNSAWQGPYGHIEIATEVPWIRTPRLFDTKSGDFQVEVCNMPDETFQLFRLDGTY